MASYKDKSGAVFLPTVDEGGAVPVAVEGLVAEDRVGLLILRELRRIALILAQSQGIPASAFEPLPEIDGL